jgi:hypothetical protein
MVSMSYEKAVAWIVVGLLLLTAILGVGLVVVDAGELPFLLLMPVVLCVGGIVNYFAVGRYDSAGPRRQ